MNSTTATKEAPLPLDRGAPADPMPTAALRPAGTPSVWSLGYVGLLGATVLAWLLVGYYAWFIKPFVTLPADILMWGETNFVGDIIKLRTGTPIYTAPSDNNALIYTPGPPLATYAVAWLVGQPTSIPAWRVIQFGFVLAAVIFAVICCRLLFQMAYPGVRLPYRRTWLALWTGTLLLAATAPEVNKFVHCLHADALALLISMLSLLTVVLYLRSPSWKLVVLMALCPALGYFTKQFLVSWAVVMAIVVLFNRPRRLDHLALLIVLAGLFVGAVVGLCYLLWGDAFLFWTTEVMGGERKQISFKLGTLKLSVARMADHVNQAWFEIAIGLAGGWMLLRGAAARRIGPLWVGWLALIASEAFSSGAGWGVLYHFGPGIVIGTIFFLVALSYHWSRPSIDESPVWSHPAARGIAGAAVMVTVFLALRAVPTGNASSPRSPQRQPPADVYRYIADIEREFEGMNPERVLLDVGNWVYLPHSVVMKDRAISLGDQPTRGMYENFDVMIGRLRSGAYDKVLVRDFDSGVFLYDYSDAWPRPSGIRQLLLDHYTAVRTIPAAQGNLLLTPGVRHCGPVTVFVPKSDAKR